MDQEYTNTILIDETLVRLTTSGSFDYLKALQTWQNIIATCEEHECFRILVDSNIDEPLPALDVDHASDFFDSVGLTDKYRLAVVTADPEIHERHRIAETALKNHASFKAAAFGTERQAKLWLERGS